MRTTMTGGLVISLACLGAGCADRGAESARLQKVSDRLASLEQRLDRLEKKVTAAALLSSARAALPRPDAPSAEPRQPGNALPPRPEGAPRADDPVVAERRAALAALSVEFKARVDEIRQRYADPQSAEALRALKEVYAWYRGRFTEVMGEAPPDSPEP
jgi:outer membrane murein-binding lipoprotein Lpp